MSHLPFPSNENASPLPGLLDDNEPAVPWVNAAPTEPPPMMLQVEFEDGRVISYSYADLREIRTRDAGYLQLCIFGMEKYHVTIEGRNLKELAKLLVMGRVKSVCELGERTYDRAEAEPAIDTIRVETLTGPGY